jgi:hypothetical protein
MLDRLATPTEPGHVGFMPGSYRRRDDLPIRLQVSSRPRLGAVNVISALRPVLRARVAASAFRAA